MTEPIEAAIKIALYDKAIAFAATQSPPLTIALPNGVGSDAKPFQTPSPGPTVQWLRASVLPVPTRSTGIAFNARGFYSGFLQIDVLQGIGGGEAPIDRTVGALTAYFRIGTKLIKDGLSIEVLPNSMMQVPYPGPLVKDGTAWVFIPVSIPYQCITRPA